MIKQDIHPADIMVCAISKLLLDNEIVFHGVSSQLPMVAIMLAKQLHAKNMTYVNIPGGINPTPRKLSTYSSAGAELYNQSEGVFRLEDVFDLSMRGKLDVAFLSGVQFDKEGNVNASVIGDYHKPKVRLPGGAGSAVLIPTVKKAIIWRSKHDIRTFVENIDFVTTRGNIYKVITPLCLFKYEAGLLDVEAISPLTTIDEVVKNTGFKISTDNYKVLDYPTTNEMRLLKKIDPNKERYNEF
ncbi:MAG: CoA-transferase subunit beta [Eubacteriales bacterium]